MEVHAVSGGWVLEWSGCTGSSIVKATVGVAGFLVVASGVVQGVRQHRSLRWNSHKGRLATKDSKDSDAAGSNSETKELDGESASQAPDNQRVVIAMAISPDLPPLDVSGADSPRSRIGRGLESIGGMTADTIQRISTAVGGVVKSPVVLMAKVGGLASPRLATLTSSPGSSLEDRVFLLEMQMKSFEEKFNSRTAVTELNPSPQSHKDKPRAAKSLLQEMETEGALVKRVQMLEDRVNERMERIEKALSSIQSQLDHVDFSRRESMDSYERQESLSVEPHYYDAEQQSDNFETLEGFEQSVFEERSAGLVSGEAFGASRALEQSPVKEPMETDASSGEPVKRVRELHAGETGDVSFDPQLTSTSIESKEALVNEPMQAAASTSEASKEALVMEPMEAAAPSGEPAESVQRDATANAPSSSNRQLASTLEDLHESFMTEPSAAAVSAECLKFAKTNPAEKSSMARASSEPGSASVIEEPREAFPEKPSAAKSEEPAQDDAPFKVSSVIAGAESSSPPKFEALQEDFAKELLAAAPNAKPAQELATQEDSDMALASSEPPVASKFAEETSAAAPGTNSEVPAQEDTGDKNGTAISAAGLRLASSLEESEGESGHEFVAGAPRAEPAQELATQVGKDMTLAAPENQVVSTSVEEPSVAATSAHFDELVQEVAAEKTDTANAAIESSQASSLEESKEALAISSLAAAPSGDPAQIHSDVAVASSETEGASTFVEETPASTPSSSFEESKHENDADNSGTLIAAGESELSSSLNNPQEECVKDSLGAAPSAGFAQESATYEDSSMALATHGTTAASKSVEMPTAVASAGFQEPAHEDVDDKMIAAAELPLPSSHQGLQEDFVKESLAAAPAQEPSPREDSRATRDMALASSESSKFAEDPSPAILNGNFEEPAQEDGADRGDTVIIGVESPLSSSFEERREDSEKESLAAAPSAESAQESATHEDRSRTLAAPESSLTSKFAEEPSRAVASTGFQEPADEDAVEKSDESITMTAAGESPLASSVEGPQEDFEKEALASAPSTEPAQELATQEDGDMAPSKPSVAPQFVEEPLTADVSDANFEEPAHEDTVDKRNTMTGTGEDPSLSSLEDHREDYTGESLSAGASAKVLEPTESGNKPIAFAPLETPSASFYGLPLEALSKEPSGTNVRLEEPAQESGESPIAVAPLEVPSASFYGLPQEALSKEPSGTSFRREEPVQESGKSPTAFAPLEAESASFYGLPQEALSKEPSGTRVRLEEPAQAKSKVVLPSADSTLTSTVEEDNHAAREAECKLAEDAKVPDELIESSEEEFPRSRSNLAHVGSHELKPESLAAEDSNDRLESDQSGEEFFDAEHGSGGFEPWESVESTSLEEFVVDPDERGEAMGITAAAQKDTLVPAPSAKPAQDLDQASAREFVQEPEQAPAREPDQHPPTQEGRQPVQQPAREHGQQDGRHQGQRSVQHGHESDQAPAQEPEQPPTQEPAQEHGHGLEQQSEQKLARGPEQEYLARNSDMSLASSEPKVAAKFEESQELLAEEPLGAVPSTKFEESAQANATDENSTRYLPSTVKDPQIDPVGSPEKTLPSASFHPNFHPETLETLEQKSLDEVPGPSSPPQETFERESSTAAPTTETAQGHGVGNSDKSNISLEPQVASTLEKSEEAVNAVPGSESTEPAQGVDGAILASSEPQLTRASQEPQEGFVKEPVAAAEMPSESVDLEESLAESTPSAELAQEGFADRSSAELVGEPPLTPIAEEPQNGSVSSPEEFKPGQSEADQKALEDVKIDAEPIVQEPIARTRSDLTHAKLQPELQDQGSFLTFGAPPVKEPNLPSTTLVELFEEERLGKKDPVPADSPMTFTVGKEPPKPLASAAVAAAAEEPPLAGATPIPKPGHVTRRRGFVRSASEPQFAYKLEEHRKGLVKESSVAAVPSASKFEQRADEDFSDTQCLPFRILGDGKHTRKESEFKLVEDVKSPAPKSEAAASYVLEPVPSRIKTKKKKEKERKPDAAVEEKQRRHSAVEMERKSSLRAADEKDSKYSPRAEEKHKQPFKHLRERLRHAFSVNKEP